MWRAASFHQLYVTSINFERPDLISGREREEGIRSGPGLHPNLGGWMRNGPGPYLNRTMGVAQGCPRTVVDGWACGTGVAQGCTRTLVGGWVLCRRIAQGCPIPSMAWDLEILFQRRPAYQPHHQRHYKASTHSGALAQLSSTSSMPGALGRYTMYTGSVDGVPWFQHKGSRKLVPAELPFERPENPSGKEDPARPFHPNRRRLSTAPARPGVRRERFESRGSSRS
ncbi:hypothetical protein FA13DRAFT_1712910 [Coprinellus micaceus]|uniref:Uncharacterized protein n=1 Tax=Coprinellus micaceus TaxID=71717 RepID=A0A4Y7SYY3_COPMI|nr:hypothetical protein FA13DRAFT_1712910 [Coprinellus micaceus]